MNKVILMGRLTRDPQISWGTRNNSQEQIRIARYALAVDRRGKDAGTDYPSIVAFRKAGEFTESKAAAGQKGAQTAAGCATDRHSGRNKSIANIHCM